MEPVHEEEYKGKLIRIFQDDLDWSNNPRKASGNMSTIVAICPSNSDFAGIGDEHIGDLDEADALLKRLNKEHAVYVPIYGYSHSGITIRASDRPYPFNDECDSGFVGIAYVEPAQIRENFMVKHITKKVRDLALKNLRMEVETLNDYLTGNVYGYEIVEPETDAAPEEDLDSCWGFYGDYDDKDFSALTEAKSVIDSMEVKV